MTQHQRSEEQQVRDLIAGAGPRPAVPAEEVAAIEAAARGEWRRMVSRQRRRRRWRGGLALAASLLLAAAVGWWWSGRAAPGAAPVIATLELVAGSASAGGVELAAGDSLAAGALIETGGWGGGGPAGAALRLAGGQSLRLASDSGVRLLSRRRLELRRGTLYVDSDPALAAGGVEVLTPLGTVRDVGTQFEVRLSGGGSALRVRVREGEVSLEADGGRHLAARGEQLTLLGEGPPARAGIDVYGPEWDWVVATAPGIPIDGLPLRSALDWIERETGRQVRYADPALEALAESAIVRGPFEGFTPGETLAAVLDSNGLGHRLEDGAIVVTR